MAAIESPLDHSVVMIFVSFFGALSLPLSNALRTAAASTAAKTEEDKTDVGTVDVSLGVSGAVRRHTKEDSSMRWAIVHRSALCVDLLAFC